MTWLDGRPLMRRLEEDPPQEERNAIAVALFKAWYVPFYRYGVIHGDPHLGNYQVRPDGTVNLLDYGAIRVFPAKFVRGVIDLYEAVRDDDADKTHAAYESWGFTELTREKMDVLSEWARFLYEPLIEDRVRRITETDDPQFGRAVAQKVHARAAAHRRRDTAARVRAARPQRHRPGRRVHAAEGGAELVAPVPRADRRFRYRRRWRRRGGRRRWAAAGPVPSWSAGR